MAVLDYLTKFMVGYIVLTVAFYMLSLKVPKAGFVARVLASYISLVIAALFGVAASIVLRFTGSYQLAQWATARCFAALITLTTGITFEVIDPRNTLTNTRPGVFVANHQSELDVAMLGWSFPKYCSMTAKSSLKKTPFLGWFMILSGAIFINRSNTKDARQAMAGASEEIRSKRQSVYMFPEGTRSYSKEPELLPFKKGAFHLAVQAQVPIVPIVCANYSHVLWVKGLVFRGGKIPIKILDPISTKGLTAADVDELTRSTRELMLKELVSLTEQARGKTGAVKAQDSNGVAKVTGSDAKAAA